MARVVLGVEYHGENFFGWQTQPNLRTVQTELEGAIAYVADHPIRAHCAGRTDTGVHASGQVIHFDTTSTRSLRAWTFGVNSKLPKDVSIRWAKLVSDDFHARHSATSRHYRYLIYNNPNRPALFHANISWQYRQLNHYLMHEAAQHLIGEHDFSSFRAIHCQSQTPMRHVMKCDVKRKGDLLIVDMIANAYLHHMVRNIVGVLILIGLGKHDVSWTKELLEARDRSLGAETAPACGLYLIRVNYPPEWELPSVKAGPMFLRELGC